MAVVIETTLGDITVDLYTKKRPRACLNFLKLCKMKYYNYSLFHTVSRDFIAQAGDPTGSRKGGESIFGVLEGPLKRYFESETHPRIKHTITGLVSFVGIEDNMIGSQFFITLAPELTYLDDRHCVFGEVAEGLEVLELLNDAICDTDNRPYQDIRITHTVVLDDPYPDLERLRVPSRSPSPSAERLQGGRIAPDEEIEETADVQMVEEIKADREAKARATILEMVGDIPDAEMAPPENVLFVCKLNPVTTDDDLEIIFSRFGKINSCEVIRDRKTGDSLQYAFIEFDEQKSCEDAYFKMDNVLIDDRRIHVDFSQSVAKVKWLGKGRGVAHFDEKGRKTDDKKNDVGQGNYRRKNPGKSGDRRPLKREKSPKNKAERDRSPKRHRSPEDRRDRSKYKKDSRYKDEREYSRASDRRSNDYYMERSKSDRYHESRSSRDKYEHSRDKRRSDKRSDERTKKVEKSTKRDSRRRRSSTPSETSESEDADRRKAKARSQKQRKQSSSSNSSSKSSEETYKKKKNLKKKKRRDSSD